MTETIAIIAPGEMGSAVGRRLKEHGARVVTSLAERSKATAARAERAGLEVVEDEHRLVALASVILSIVPPGEALSLAERLGPLIAPSREPPIFVDCNAVSPRTAKRIGAVLARSRCRYIDAAIIGPPPSAGTRTVFYASGEWASAMSPMGALGLDIRVLEAPIGAASALKMSYAGITKGLTALGSTMMLGAERAGAADALRRELAESQPHLLAYLTRAVPAMFPKAYRWVAEMEEIAAFLAGDEAGQQIYQGTARLYQRLAGGAAAPDEGELGTLAEFCRKAAEKPR
jgi:3-hydroxyisobutyrate dehydrogenase-like beta-hydroxyacid dehydrogenase